MPHLDHTAFVNSRRDERSLGHHTLRAYAQDLRTFARFTKAHHLSDPLSKDDILAYHRHLREELGAKPATIERRPVNHESDWLCMQKSQSTDLACCLQADGFRREAGVQRCGNAGPELRAVAMQ
ncbi:site-specific integrase [uncultured Roseobacter sp.]|uniref:site-specific integrase n=1 Tax=uncultured Roseobacter sp. TaxID=114847 RepID=UPI00262FC37D|nr:site-specific integrase [uncultured Roseobacter sp.]